MTDARIIVALDMSDAGAALELVARFEPRRVKVKVGKELFTYAGPRLVTRLVDAGFDVFLDLKFHDIPNTVAGACAAAADLGVWMVNVHASGGRAMLAAARDSLARLSKRPLLTAVTVLTSMTAADLADIGIAATPEEQALRLARLAASCGIDGVVCAPQESRRLRADLGDRFLLVTPGIRPAQSGSDDQKRIATPAAALNAGANYLVIGRPVTQAADPIKALEQIEDDIRQTIL